MIAEGGASIASPLPSARRGLIASLVGQYLFLAAVVSSVGRDSDAVIIDAWAYRACSRPPRLDHRNRSRLASNGWNPAASSRRPPPPSQPTDERDRGVGGGGDNIVVGPPLSLSDYRGVGDLLADADQDENGDDAFASRIGITLTRVRSFVATRRYANEYVATARRMRGKKYALLLAKAKTTAKAGGSDNDGGGGGGGGGGEVVGMAEVGLSSYEFIVPPPSSRSPSSPASSSPAVEPPAPSCHGVGVVASVGVLAVSPPRRRSGVGSALLAASERAAASWGEAALHAAVEPGNDRALAFFGGMGYRPVTVTPDPEDLDGDGGDEGGRGGRGAAALVSVAVREGSITVRRPHLLLRKELPAARIEDMRV